MASAHEDVGKGPLSSSGSFPPALEDRDDGLLELSRHLDTAENVAIEDADFHGLLCSTVADIVQAGEVALWGPDTDGTLRVLGVSFGFSGETPSLHLSDEQTADLVGAATVIPLPGAWPTSHHDDTVAVGIRTADRSLGLFTAAGSTRADGFSADDLRRLRIAALGAAFMLEHRRIAAERQWSSADRPASDLWSTLATRRTARLDLLHLVAGEMREALSAAQGDLAAAVLHEGQSDRLAERLAGVLSVLPMQLEQISRVISELRPPAAVTPGGRLQLEREPVRLCALVAEVVRAADLLTGDESPFVVEMRSDPLVNADRRALTSMVVTLLVGSLRTASRGDAIRLSCDETGEMGTISISQPSRGAGSDGRLAAPATPVARLAVSTSSGTANVHILARLHGGQVTTDEAAGWLTTTVMIPLLPADAEPQIEPGADQADAPVLNVFHDRQVVERDGRRQRLTWTEWQLFAFLWAHPGTTFSRNELANAIWGTELVDRSAEVEMYISRVRRKVERDARHPAIIVTERHQGYRLDRPAGNRAVEV